MMSTNDRLRRLARRIGGHRLAEDAPVAALLSEAEIDACLAAFAEQWVAEGGDCEMVAREVAAIRALARGGGDAKYN